MERLSLSDRYADAILKYRRFIGVGLLLLTAFAVFGYIYEPPVQPEAAERVRLVPGSVRANAVDAVLVIETKNFFREESLAALRQVAEELEALDVVDSVVWVDRVPTLNAFGLAEPLLPRGGATPQQFVRAKERTLAHPLVAGQLVSDDSSTVLMLVNLNWLEVTSDSDCTDLLLETAREAAKPWPDEVDRIRLTGRVPLYLAARQSMDRNRIRSQLIAYSLTFTIAIIIFRGLRTVLIVGGAPALAVFWTMGMLDLMDELNNPLTTVVLPVLLSMVGLTDGVHLMVHIRDSRAAGANPEEASRQALRRVGPACFLTSLTTATGFAALLLAESEFVRGFGRSCCVGVIVSYVAVITVVPLMSLTKWAQVSRRWRSEPKEDSFENVLLERAVDFILRHSYAVTAAAILLTAGLGVLAFQLRPDDRLRDAQPSGSEAYAALQHCDDVLGGIEAIQVRVRWSETIADDAPEILQAVADVEQLLADEQLISHPLSILSILSTFPGDAELHERLPFVALLPLAIRDTLYSETTNETVVTGRVRDLGIATYNPVFDRLRAKFIDLQKRYPECEFELAGAPVRRGATLHQIVTDLSTSLLTASVIIFIMLGVAYRSLRLGLISIIPNVLPLAATAAMLYFMNRSLDIASVCSFTVCLGIAVDDTIHFLTRYQIERSAGHDELTAIRRAYVGVGKALIMTTIILVSGFTTVVASDLPGHRSFAQMACMTIGAALVADLLFLPALLAIGHRPARGETKAMRDSVAENDQALHGETP